MNTSINTLIEDALSLLDSRHDLPLSSLRIETEELSHQFAQWTKEWSTFVNALDAKRDEMEEKLYELDDSQESHKKL